jgi:hypothetical protein
MLTQWIRGSVAVVLALFFCLGSVGCDDAKGEIERTLDELGRLKLAIACPA